MCYDSHLHEKMKGVKFSVTYSKSSFPYFCCICVRKLWSKVWQVHTCCNYINLTNTNSEVAISVSHLSKSIEKLFLRSQNGAAVNAASQSQSKFILCVYVYTPVPVCNYKKYLTFDWIPVETIWLNQSDTHILDEKW